LIKNSQPFGKIFRKPYGDFYLTHTVLKVWWKILRSFVDGIDEMITDIQ